MSWSSAVRKPIKCPKCCSVITAIPVDGWMYLTPAAAGFFPSGYRCRTCGVPELVPQPAGAPERLTEKQVEFYLAKIAEREAAKEAA